MKNVSDLVTGILLILFSLICFTEVKPIPIEDLTDPLGPSAFPKAILLLIIIFSCVLIYNSFRHASPKKEKKNVKVKTLYCFIALSMLYMGLFIFLEYLFASMNMPALQNYISFILSTALFLMASFYLFGRRNIFEITMIAVCVPTFIVFVFSYFFNVIVP